MTSNNAFARTSIPRLLPEVAGRANVESDYAEYPVLGPYQVTLGRPRLGGAQGLRPSLPGDLPWLVGVGVPFAREGPVFAPGLTGSLLAGSALGSL